MGRPPQPHIRQQLLEACTDHALEHGLPDRLAPFAAATHTSPRMLLYHFQTRDRLLSDVLAHARRRQVDTFTALLQAQPGQRYVDTLRDAWRAMSGPTGEPYLRMFNRLHDTAGQPYWPEFRRVATTDWLAPLESGLRSTGRPELATLVLAVIRGLLMDLNSTEDITRVDQAFEDFLAALPGW